VHGDTCVHDERSQDGHDGCLLQEFAVSRDWGCTAAVSSALPENKSDARPQRLGKQETLAG
jgi:hypothetical protein